MELCPADVSFLASDPTTHLIPEDKTYIRKKRKAVDVVNYPSPVPRCATSGVPRLPGPYLPFPIPVTRVSIDVFPVRQSPSRSGETITVRVETRNKQIRHQFRLATQARYPYSFNKYSNTMFHQPPRCKKVIDLDRLSPSTHTVCMIFAPLVVSMH